MVEVAEVKAPLLATGVVITGGGIISDEEDQIQILQEEAMRTKEQEKWELLAHPEDLKEDIVTGAKRVKVLQKRQKDLKKRLAVSAKRKDVNLGYSIYKIFLIYIE